MKRAFNAKTKAATKLGSSGPDQVADGVWLVRGGFPGKTMNVYLVQDGDGVMLFDAGVRSMTNAVARRRRAARRDHARRARPRPRRPPRRRAGARRARCSATPAEKADAEGDGGAHYFHFERLNPVGKLLLPRLLPSWDGGPVTISRDPRGGRRDRRLQGHPPPRPRARA